MEQLWTMVMARATRMINLILNIAIGLEKLGTVAIGNDQPLFIAPTLEKSFIWPVDFWFYFGLSCWSSTHIGCEPYAYAKI